MFTGVCEGPIFYCGDKVNTDVMSPGRFEPYEGRDQLARIALIDYESPEPFVPPGGNQSRFRIIVAGEEFGCGSSRETAPMAIAYAGVQVVVAKSFARIFFRNCVNMGLLLPIQIDHSFGPEVLGQVGVVDFDRKVVHVADNSFPIPDFGPLESIIKAGGLLAYTRQKVTKTPVDAATKPESI